MHDAKIASKIPQKPFVARRQSCLLSRVVIDAEHAELLDRVQESAVTCQVVLGVCMECLQRALVATTFTILDSNCRVRLDQASQTLADIDDAKVALWELDFEVVQYLKVPLTQGPQAWPKVEHFCTWDAHILLPMAELLKGGIMLLLRLDTFLLLDLDRETAIMTRSTARCSSDLPSVYQSRQLQTPVVA